MEQLIKNLRFCADEEADCMACARWTVDCGNRYCLNDLMLKAADAIEKLQAKYIRADQCGQELQAENAQLRKDFNTAVERLAVVGYELMQGKKERDAAVAVLRGRCFACKHSRPSEKFKGMFVCDFMDALARNGRFPECKHWQWRGVQEGRK